MCCIEVRWPEEGRHNAPVNEPVDIWVELPGGFGYRLANAILDKYLQVLTIGGIQYPFVDYTITHWKPVPPEPDMRKRLD